MQNYILQLNSAGVSEGCWSTIATLVWSTPNIAKSQTVVQQCAQRFFAMHPFTLKVLLYCLLLFITVYIHPSVHACVHETRVYSHTGTMNHLAENLSLISHLRFLFTLCARAPFPPLSLTVFSSVQIAPQVSSTTRQSFTTMAKQWPISSLYGLWNWLKTGPAVF